jgi:hypothetical protein
LANVEHSALTGSDLHEPKGVAAAAANRVYVSDGAASGSWTTVSNSVLATEAKAFQAGLLHIQDQKASGTNGGTFTSGAWRTRDLNTVLTNEITSASLASNQITLPAGTYFIIARAPAFFVDEHQARLQNITDGTTLLTGSCGHVGADMSNSFVWGRFTLGGTKVLELQHQCSTTRATDGFGNNMSFGTVVFAEVLIWKVA